MLNYDKLQGKKFKTLESQIYKNFQLHIISIQEEINHIEESLKNKNIDYKIIKKNNDSELPSIFNEIINTTKSDYVIFLKDGVLYQN